MRLPILLLLSTSLAAAAAVDFSHQIVPILREHCAECHAGEKKKGGFSFNDRTALMEGGENGAVVVRGKSAESALIKALLSSDPDEQMPPKGKRVPAEQVALLKQWIDEGLEWEEGFAFKKPAYEPPLLPRTPQLPAAVDGRNNPVDRILDHYLVQQKVARPAAVDDATFARRASLDLVGLLPAPQELEAFTKDTSADKRTRWIDALLKRDMDYTEHWLTFWNDLLRNDYGGTGFITGGRKQISNWLYHALMTNMPFDQFVRELISPPNDESRGFIDGIKWRGDVSAGQTVEIQFAQSVSQSFLGINMKCASCHDSFIDRWKLSEAYGLAAIYSARPLEINRCDKPIGQQAVPSWLFPEIGQVDPKAAPAERLKQLAALMTHPKNGRVTRTIVNRLWQRLMGRGIVHPVDAMQTEPWNADLLDYLAVDFAEHRYDLKRTLSLIATSQAYQSHAQVMTKGIDDHGYTYAGPRTKRLTAEQFVDAIWQITGAAPAKMDAGVLRGKVDPELAKQIKIQGQWIWGSSAKPGSTPPSGETITLRTTIKLESDPASASAVVTCDNGYTLFVNNRKVSAGDDWTKLAAVPLQTALRKGPNSILVIATNAGKGPNAAGFFLDARVRDAAGKEKLISSDATWEWSAKAPPAKEGRIAAFDPKDWQPVTVVKALGAWQQAIQSQAPTLLAQGASASDHMIRASLMKSDFLMRTLGRPNRDQIVTARPNDLTTLEAIDLANGGVLAGAIAKGAQKLLAVSNSSPAALITSLYQRALCRVPSANELATAQGLIGEKPTQQSLEDLLWAVCMLPEFQVVR
ncbi:DUF1549 domain-containing protein [Prosthecobacter sp.]|uniref:DUF1549 domain-containing protein n=1 Tax=Prosthecobacter sp. TaxID=1965333 RepID=UPI003782DB38